ncbi:MAG: ATP-binding protein [Cytophagales bacterium]|nr:MAG: ATP-binding protein [Cytophagales bacterium]
MLIQFSVKNYKTFADEVKISMVASKDDTLKEKNVFDSGFGYDLLKSAVVYGANASGKTKLIEAMGFMRKLIEKSSGYNSTQKIDVQPFRLNTQNEKEPSLFEVIFIEDDNKMYRYGFEVTKEKIISEWLFMRQNNGKPKETELFYREEQNFEYNKAKFKVKNLIDNDRVKHNTLLLSRADVDNEKTANKVFHWITDKWRTISGLNSNNYLGFTASKLEDQVFKNQIISFLKDADLGIQDLKPKLMDLEDLPKQLQELILKESEGKETKLFSDVTTFRKKYNELKEPIGLVEFSMEDDESSGTGKYFALSAPILDALLNGNIFVVDELDAALHPNLVCKIVELFNSSLTNPKNAQLIFNTHNTNLLSPDAKLFRRDQIWFTEKNHYGAAILYSLADFKTDKVRKEDNYERNYILGKYGAIPFLGDFGKILNQ